MSSILLVFASWRMAVVLLMGFASGLPLALTGGTLQAWMTGEHVDLTLIGIFSLVGIPYTLKFLWSPIMDRYIPPFLGRRRGWLLISQLLLALAICGMAVSSPSKAPSVVATLAFLVAFFSASQDIVVDAYRTEISKPEELGAAAALYIMGYRIAMLVSGGLALVLADHFSWRAVYFMMAGAMGIGVVTTFLAPESSEGIAAPRTLQAAVVEPLLEFFKRPGALEVLVFIIIYKLDVAMTSAMSTPFMLQAGFTKTDIGVVYKGMGLVATIVGTLAGGGLMATLGIRRSLWAFGLLQAVSNLSYMMLAILGHSYPMMVTAIAVENVCSAMGTAAFAAFIMSLCDKRFTATQYALLTSFMALSRVFASAPTGFFAKLLGWPEYFLVCTLAGAPGLLLLTRYRKWNLPVAT